MASVKKKKSLVGSSSSIRFSRVFLVMRECKLRAKEMDVALSASLFQRAIFYSRRRKM